MTSPESWLRATDPARIHHVTVTDEDVQHATQERGAVDSLPPIRNRPGIRRALNAALAKFPAFSRMKSPRPAVSGAPEDPKSSERDARTRSKSNSSAAHSIDPTAESSASGVSRQPSDAGGAPLRAGKGKFSYDGATAQSGNGSGGGGSFGSELRRIISGGHAHNGEGGQAGTSPGHLSRGGWGSARRKLTPTNTLEPHSPPNASSLFPELARSTSTSSVGNGGNGRSGPMTGWFQRRPSDSDTSGLRSPVSSLPSPGPAHRMSMSPSPYAGSETETSNVNGKGSGTLSRMLSRIAHGPASGTGSSAATSATGSLHSKTSGRSEREPPVAESHVRALTADGIDPAIVEQFEAAGTNRAQYDSLGRLIAGRKGHAASRSSLRISSLAPGSFDDNDDEDGAIDLTDFEYSDSDDDDDDNDDDLDDLNEAPIGGADHLSGWQPATFGDFRIGVRSPSDERNLARGMADISSPLDTPPTDEVGPLDLYEEDGKIGAESTASAAAASRPQAEQQPSRETAAPKPVDIYVPLSDTVSFSLCPLDFDVDAWRMPPAPADPAVAETARVDARSSSVATRRDQAPLSIAPTLLPPACERHDSSHSSQASQSPRDGSIRNLVLDTPGTTRKVAPQWEDAKDPDGDEDEEEEMLVVPRRRRAATLSGSGQATPHR